MFKLSVNKVEDVSVFGGLNMSEATSSRIDIQKMSIHPETMPGLNKGNVIVLNNVQPLLPEISLLQDFYLIVDQPSLYSELHKEYRVLYKQPLI